MNPAAFFCALNKKETEYYRMLHKLDNMKWN